MSVVPRMQRVKAIGSALEKYIKRAHEHSLLMERERAQFERGKRHLANIMGWDPKEEIKQADIDAAIAYLLPTGLTDKLAQPVLKPPEEILPTFKYFSFDDEGRPRDSLFYTLRPKFYGLLSVCFMIIF